MQQNTKARGQQFVLTFEWDEMDGFVNGRAVLRAETEDVTVYALSAAAALAMGREMLADYDEGTTLRAVTPA